jgi:two-component system, NarL family, sensor kinase
VAAALTKTLKLVTRLLGLRTGWVWLLDPATDQFYNAASHNLPPYLQKPIRMTGSWCKCTQAFRDRELTPKNIDVIECSRLEPAVRRNSPLTLGLRYHASIPLYSGTTPLGIMNVTGPAWRKLTADELRLLSTIGYQVGVTIERARLTEESARLARYEERTRAAREIHDTLAQSLTAITLQLDGALKQLDASGADKNPELEQARHRLLRALDVARDGLEEARRSVLSLRGAPVAASPLPVALRELARTFTSQTGVRVRVSIAGGRELPAAVENELYRIAQEALANVHKHAGVNETRVALKIGARRVSLSVIDSGRGFSRSAPRGDSHGIVGMRERAELVGGTLVVDSTPGRGTTVTATVPA